ncbi:MAG: flagellar protein [Lachnospiraceae bacterium]|nr:flagellar protein [Lachnospiraceae bacterium]
MDIQKNGFLSIEQVQDQYLHGTKSKQTVKPETSFSDILRDKSRAVLPTQDVKFSKHAQNRLTDRNISLSEEQMTRLNDATQKASAKGIKESLVILDSLAFIVNIPNNTVVTALDQTESDDNVFTNIDGAVIV